MVQPKDLFLPYEESLNLQELAFDEPCIATYRWGNKTPEGFSYLWLTNKDRFSSVHSKAPLLQYGFGAPLYQQVEDFFRRKGYHIDIYSDNHQDILNADNWYWLFSKGINTSCTDSFGSYEEARLDCIRALIKTELNNKS